MIGIKKILIYIFLFSIAFGVFAKKDGNPQRFIYSQKVPAIFDAVRLARLDSALQKLVNNGTIPTMFNLK